MPRIFYDLVNGERSLLEVFIVWHLLLLFLFYYIYFNSLEVLSGMLPAQVFVIVTLALPLMLFAAIGASLFFLWRSAVRRSGIFSILARGYVILSVASFAISLPSIAAHFRSLVSLVL